MNNLPPPREKLPGNILSYNAPLEFKQENNYSKMHHIPQYSSAVDDRLLRCLELYLCTREARKKFDPLEQSKKLEQMLQKIPSPMSLRPFPEILSVIYESGNVQVNSISVDPTGQWLVSGDNSGNVKLWEITTGRCLRVWSFQKRISNVEFNPNPEVVVFLVSADNVVFVIAPKEISTQRINRNSEALFTKEEKKKEDSSSDGDVNIEELYDSEDEEEEEEPEDEKKEERKVKMRNKKGKKRLLLEWKMGKEEGEMGVKIRLIHRMEVKQATWHPKGDYFASLCENRVILLHQLSVKKSQKPFQKANKKSGGKYIKIMFHPKKPLFYLVSETKVKIYNLQKQKLVKLIKGQKSKRISDMAIDTKSETVLFGGHDRIVEVMQPEISTKSAKVMKFHKNAIRRVKYHSRYPLFASCSDDANIHIFHLKVFEDDFLQDPLIVPLKILTPQNRIDFLGVMDIQFHPFQPWIFSAGSDGLIKLYTC